MPTVENANLTLKTVDDKVTIIVDFDGRFTHFERQLNALGLKWHSHAHWHSVRAAKRPACGFAVAGGVGAPASCHAA
jgi:hypothetical protein